jgi:hypothetical protein
MQYAGTTRRYTTLCRHPLTVKKAMWWMRERIKDVGWTYRVMLHEFLKFNIVGISILPSL